MAKIVSIIRKNIDNQKLLNLAVKDDESFIANDIVVHNCKSYIVPIFDLGNRKIDERGLKPSDPKLDKFANLKN